MSDLAPRPRNATELVDAAFQVYRKYPTQFIVATGIVYVPWLVVRLVLGVGVRAATPSFRDLGIAAIGTMIAYVIVGGLVTRMANDVYLDRRVSVGDALRQVAGQLGTLTVAALLRFFLLVLGLFAFIVGVFYPLARFFALVQVIVIEGGGVGAAFSRSSTLSQNIKMHILGTLALLFIINVAVSIGVAFLVSVLGNRVLEQVLSTVMSVLVYPLYGIGETLLYVDARIRNEGYDVELLAATSSPGDQVLSAPI
jgi:hypothetical protein